MAQTFYRIVRTTTPTLEDFKSHQALGRPFVASSPEKRLMWEGVSVFVEVREAQRMARRYSTKMGRYIAELEIPDDSSILCEETGGNGHHTLWGSPDELLACITGRIVDA